MDRLAPAVQTAAAMFKLGALAICLKVPPGYAARVRGPGGDTWRRDALLEACKTLVIFK